MAINGGKPFFDFGGGITAQNTLSHHGFLQTIEAALEFFVVPVDLVVKSVDFAVQLGIQRFHRSAEFTQGVKGMILRVGHSDIPCRVEQT